jgi:hypothetical protein
VRRLPYGSSPSINGFMTAVVAAFSLQDKIEQYGAYAGIAAVFGLGILSLLYFAQAREVKRLRDWAGRAPERAAELEARVQADAQRRAAEQAARPTAPATPAAQRGAAAGPGVPGAAPATAAAAAGAAAAGPATATKPATGAPQNGTGSGAAVPPPGTEAGPAEGDGKPAEDGKPAAPDAKPAVPGVATAAAAGAAAAAASAATAPSAPGAAPATPGSAPGAPGATPSAPGAAPGDVPATPDAKPPVPAATAAAAAPRPAAALRAPATSTSLPPRTSPGARTPTGDDGRSRGRLAAIVGAALGVVAVLVVAGILIFGGGGGGNTPAPRPNTVGQPSGGTAGAKTTTSKTTAKLDRRAVPLAVLNGTTVTGLARGAANKLASKGYQQPNVVTNDTTNQARAATEIFYEAQARTAALDVAKILGVPAAQVKPMDANARALADRALVAVFVGSDKAQ